MNRLIYWQTLTDRKKDDRQGGKNEPRDMKDGENTGRQTYGN